MVTKEEARNYLRDVMPGQSFWVNNGPILKNLEELGDFLPQMSDNSFQHHVSNGKNDFGSWINDVIGDKKLADDLLSSKTKESSAKKVMGRVNSLKKKAI